MLKRAIMVGCNAAGVNVEDLEVATVPVTRHHVRTSAQPGGVTVRLAADDPQSVVIRFFDEEGLDIAEPAQRKIERLYHREEFRRVLAARDRRHRLPAAGRGALHGGLMEPVDLTPSPGGRSSSWSSTTPSASASFVMPNVLAKLERRGAGGQPLRPHAGDDVASTGPPARPGWPIWCGPRGPTSARSIDPGGEHLTLVDDEGTVLSDDEALLVLLDLVVGPRPGARWPCRWPCSRAAERDLRRGRGRDHLDQALGHPPDGGGGPGGVTFAASQTGGFIFPGFLPAFDAAATLVDLVAMLARHRPDPVRAGRRPPPGPHRPRGGVTPWEQKGMVMRTLVEQLGAATLVLVDGVKVPEDDGWALVVPDPEEPVTHVWAEARATPRPGRGPRSTPSGSARCCADPAGRRAAGRGLRTWGVGRSGRVRAHERSRRAPLLDDHEWARPAAAGCGSASPTTPRTRSATSSSSTCPAVGTDVERRRALGEVESTKSVSEIYAPVAGEVVAVNTALADAPELLNQDPYGEGWICEIELADPGAARRRCSTPAAYRQLTDG